jgi:phospholipid/cholesterol/gamma-HCH transport system ATP-binding protein
VSRQSEAEFLAAVGQPPDPAAPMIEFVGVHKSFGDRKILDGVDLQIWTGETMVIMGRSGTGKSVTMKLLIGLLRPDQGRVLIKGRDVTDLPESKYAIVRRLFGVLFQSGALINWMTVGENVALPLREHSTLGEAEIQAKVAEMLKLFELSHARDLLPSEISGGMKKRAGLARGLILDPEVVLYDEPTSGLDPVMTSQIDELVRKVQRELNVTSVFVTHDMGSAYHVADRISMLYKGRIIYTGTPDDVRSTDDPIVKQFVNGLLDGPITADLRSEEGLDTAEPAAPPPAAPGGDPAPPAPAA